MPGDLSCGVTPPMSVALPTETEKRASDALIEELRRQKTFESPSDTQKRYKVLESLQAICDEFVKRVAKEKEPKNDMLLKNARGKVFTYGSFRLGVFGPGSDIDTLVVAPKYVTRDDYFKYFPDLLVEMAPNGAITDLTVVTDAFVPIIKFEYSGISIDLIFSRVIQKQLSPSFQDLKDSGLLRGLDEAELRSLNGTRVTDEILNLVPEQSTFKLALRAIKLWAQRRAVYANIMGFPGGVAWAMLVARVCQLYPKAATSVIVNKFFLVMGQWRWPQPVLLKPIESGPLPVRVWNPKAYKGDSFHLMPVITPAYPSMCATFNITRSSMTIINRELQRGLDLTEGIMMGKRPWSDLFVKHTFFTVDYKYYISVTTASKDKEAQKVWSGYVESKVRVLVQKLELHPSIALAHAFNKGYDRRHRCKNDEEIAQVQEGSLDCLTTKDDAGLDTAEKKATGENGEPAPSTEVFTTTHYIGLQLVEKAKSLDLSYQVDEFKALCTQWKKYVDELHLLVSIGVQHVRSVNLPDDVFEAGEKKPQKKGAKSILNSKKRGPSEDVVGDPQMVSKSGDEICEASQYTREP
ncbi:poly(A) polymerase central domain-containing protein [Hirsutella rhossiliensis]|uniref:Poly(A) polymerase n=1 Tax=Hirsutella rhossiliensis TaxID=111463 RepID=A0A9P8SF50_9HYPO|nr:poly(A) polymerase central domain-containing protein [Hirsutella rhossiliensis]KAH0960528.1 poly(A) polymerase central domain-containing protein [Hirsutella rhossiliensis]